MCFSLIHTSSFIWSRRQQLHLSIHFLCIRTSFSLGRGCLPVVKDTPSVVSRPTTSTSCTPPEYQASNSRERKFYGRFKRGHFPMKCLPFPIALRSRTQLPSECAASYQNNALDYSASTRRLRGSWDVRLSDNCGVCNGRSCQRSVQGGENMKKHSEKHIKRRRSLHLLEITNFVGYSRSRSVDCGRPLRYWLNVWMSRSNIRIFMDLKQPSNRKSIILLHTTSKKEFAASYSNFHHILNSSAFIDYLCNLHYTKD